MWLAGLLFYDLCCYWHHRLGHTVALFWAAHVVHHQSEDYNLSTALRQTSSGWIGGFQEEDDKEPCIYGTRGPLRSWNPVWANVHN